MSDAQILWIDANADYAEHFTNKRFIAALVCDKDNEESDFFITNNGQSSSMLPLKEHLKMHPEVKQVAQRRLPSTTLDTLFKQHGIPEDSFDVMNLDIQGAELLALQGAERILPHIKAIYSEVNVKELYANGALMPQLDAWLGERGFQRVAVKMTQFGWEMRCMCAFKRPIRHSALSRPCSKLWRWCN